MVRVVFIYPLPGVWERRIDFFRTFEHLPWLLFYVCANPPSGDFSLGLGRLGLPDRLPFSKPKVNWLLHTRSAFRRTPSGRLTRRELCRTFCTNTKIQIAKEESYFQNQYQYCLLQHNY
jgi:hypothetical protein